LLTATIIRTSDSHVLSIPAEAAGDERRRDLTSGAVRARANGRARDAASPMSSRWFIPERRFGLGAGLGEPPGSSGNHPHACRGGESGHDDDGCVAQASGPERGARAGLLG
jgi:hypothetical protein